MKEAPRVNTAGWKALQCDHVWHGRLSYSFGETLPPQIGHHRHRCGLNEGHELPHECMYYYEGHCAEESPRP